MRKDGSIGSHQDAAGGACEGIGYVPSRTTPPPERIYGVEVPEGFAVTLAAAIESRSMTQLEAAGMIDVSRQLLSEILHGKTRVSARTMARLRGWLGRDA